MALAKLLGIQAPTSKWEMLLASTGGALAIFLIFFISHYVTDYQGAMAILPSMGAATVLLFAVPHGPLSQPWALFCGNMLGAIAGVTAAIWIDHLLLAAAVAVGAALLLMNVFRCVHPPAGATALAAVIGGESLRSLGYWYVLTPTLLNCLLLMLTAMIFNNAFAWRRYPLALMRFERTNFKSPDTRNIQLSHIERAMKDTADILEMDAVLFKHIMDKADSLMRQEKLAEFDLEVGAYYSHGKMGMGWAVRQVIEVKPHTDADQYQIIYRTVAGKQRGQMGECNLTDFAQWARQKLQPQGK